MSDYLSEDQIIEVGALLVPTFQKMFPYHHMYHLNYVYLRGRYWEFNATRKVRLESWGSVRVFSDPFKPPDEYDFSNFQFRQECIQYLLRNLPLGIVSPPNQLLIHWHPDPSFLHKQTVYMFRLAVDYLLKNGPLPIDPLVKIFVLYLEDFEISEFLRGALFNPQDFQPNWHPIRPEWIFTFLFPRTRGMLAFPYQAFGMGAPWSTESSSSILQFR
jgi:hypothetical protein